MPKAVVNNTELYYQLEGHGPLLVLANGIFQRTEAWEPLLAFLEGYSVLRYDMRGQGRSAVPPGPYTPQLHATDLLALLQHLGIQHYHLLGLSNGGVVAQVLAAQNPAGLHKLILLCTTSRLDPLLTAKVRSWALALSLGQTAARLQIALPWIWGRAYLEAHPELLSDAALEQMLMAAPTPQAQRHLLQGFLQLGDLRPSLSQVKAPTLVLSGQDDLLFPPLYGLEIAAAIPGAHFEELTSLGHVPIIEDTAYVAQHIRAFLEEA